MTGAIKLTLLTAIVSATILALAPFDARGQSTTPATAPAQPTKMFTRLTGFGIPFNVNADDPALIEIQLYLSEDEGKSWQFYSRAKTDGREFPFQADDDGEYWFALRTLDRNRKLLPAGDMSAELKIVVDTSRPTLDFRIENDAAGRVVCRWDARDQNIDPASLKIMYQDSQQASGNWQVVPNTPNSIARNGIYTDQLAWWPNTTARTLNVRAQIADAAGNVVFADRIVNVPRVAWRQRSVATAQRSGWSQPQPYPATQFPQIDPDPSPATPALQANHSTQIPKRVSNSSQSAQSNNHQDVICEGGVCRPVTSSDSPGLFTLPNSSAKQPPTFLPSQTNIQQPAIEQVGSADEFAVPPRPSNLQQPVVAASQSRMVAPSGVTSSRRQQVVRQVPHQSANQGGAINWQSENAAANGQRSATEMAVGIGTTMGRNWTPPVDQNYPQTPTAAFKVPANSGSQQTDPSITNQLRPTPAGPVVFRPEDQPGQIPVPRSVFDNGIDQSTVQHINTRRFRLNYGVDSVDPSGVEKVTLWTTQDAGATWKIWSEDPDSVSPFPVEVEQQGLYGFRIVIESRDGLAGQPPARGDKPDVWALVDLTKPFAQITSVPYGRGQEAGRLIINWQVTDPELALRPITIAYSRAASGPWTTIEHGFRNTGRYVWKVPPATPDQIFLRLEARDKAGNVAVHQLPNAIDVSGLVPRGRIHSIQRIGE